MTDKNERIVKIGNLVLTNMKLYIALEKIYHATFDSYEVIDKIVTLQEELEPVVDGYNKRHQKLIDALPKNDEGITKVSTGSTEYIKFEEEKAKLSDEEYKIKAKKILVTKNEADGAGLKLNANDVRVLKKYNIFGIRKSK